MNTKPLLKAALLAAGLVLLAGCAGMPAPNASQDTTKYTIENTEKFAALDDATQAAVACTGLQERIRPDGRFEVVANLKNRAETPLRIQVECIFRNADGYPTGDEARLQVVALATHATETVRFTAPDAKARRYTIRVRQAR